MGKLNSFTFISLNGFYKTPDGDITILGSGTILKLLAQANLVDEYQIMIDPVFSASGEPVLNHLNKNINLELIKTRVFKSGVILLHYKPKQS